jgi:hypothetical protein
MRVGDHITGDISCQLLITVFAAVSSLFHSFCAFWTDDSKSNEQSNMSAERFDRGKWWFASKDSKVYVVRKNGLVKTRGKDLEEVIRITPSSSKPDQLKVSWVTLCQHLIKYLFNAFLLLYLARSNSATRKSL